MELSSLWLPPRTSRGSSSGSRPLALSRAASLTRTAILLPLRGVSAIDREGQPFHSPEADAAYREALRAGLGPNVRLIELDAHINDPSFAEAAAEALLGMLRPG